MAARFSAINSRRAALHLVGRSGDEEMFQEELLFDDRRERAHPLFSGKYGCLPE